MTHVQKLVVLRPSEIPARQRGGGAKTIPLVTRRTGSTSFINGINIFEPEAAIPMHFHNCEESVLMLEGTAIAEIDGVEYPVAAGEMNRPRSSRFENRHAPCPSCQMILIRSRRRPRNTNRWPACGSALSRSCTSKASPGKPRRMSVCPVASHTRTVPVAVVVGTGIKACPPAPPRSAPAHLRQRRR